MALTVPAVALTKQLAELIFFAKQQLKLCEQHATGFSRQILQVVCEREHEAVEREHFSSGLEAVVLDTLGTCVCVASEGARSSWLRWPVARGGGQRPQRAAKRAQAATRA